jgi:hypothetical protein
MLVRTQLLENLPFPETLRTELGLQVLLAMQKVEDSNPFSRSQKGLHLQAFFACAVGLCVCVGSD